MEIELKNIMSEYTQDGGGNIFYAGLVINGKLAGIAYDFYDKQGTTYVALSDAGRQLIKEAENHCLTQPAHSLELEQGKLTFDMSLKVRIALLVENHLRQQEIEFISKQTQIAMKTSLLVGVDENHYDMYPLPEPILQGQEQRSQYYWLVESLEQLQPILKEGKRLLNTNIYGELLEISKLKPEQYVQPSEHIPGTAQTHKTIGR